MNLMTGRNVAWRGWLRWGIVLLILVSCVMFLDLREMGDVLRRISASWILFILALMTADRCMMVWRWSILLRALRVYVPFATLVRFHYQGALVGIFLPSSLGGDLLRAHLVSRRAGSTHEVYASLFMEKMIGFLSAVNWALIGIAVFALSRLHGIPATWIGAVVTSFLLVNGLFLLSLQRRGQAFVLRLFKNAPQSRVLDFLQGLYKAYSRYGKHRRALAWNGLLTIAEHSLQLLILLAMARSLGIDVGAILFLAVAAVHTLIYRIPISPDGWGVGEVSAIGLYGLIEVSAERAFVMAFLAHVLQLIVVLPGIWFLCRSGSVR